MKPSSLILAFSLLANFALGIYVLRSSIMKSTETSGLAARLQPLESQGRSIPSAYEQNEVRNTLTKRASAPIQGCFRVLTAKDPTVKKGALLADWQILPSGKVRSPEIVSSDLPAMNDCVVGALGSLEFPPPPTDRPVYVSHRFVFKAEESPADAGSGSPAAR